MSWYSKRSSQKVRVNGPIKSFGLKSTVANGLHSTRCEAPFHDCYTLKSQPSLQIFKYGMTLHDICLRTATMLSPGTPSFPTYLDATIATSPTLWLVSRADFNSTEYLCLSLKQARESSYSNDVSCLLPVECAASISLALDCLTAYNTMAFHPVKRSF
jgi:hypothetical protein